MGIVLIYLNENFTLDRSIESKSFFYGLGCYEFITGKKEKFLYIDEHIENLEKNMKFLNIYRKIDLKSILYEFIRLKHIEDKEFIAQVIVNDKNVYIDIKEKININKNEYYEIGIIKNIYHNELSNINSLNRITEIIAEKEIEENGFKEGIFINRENIITNCIKNNIFFIQDNILKTPEKNLNIINDVVSHKIIETAYKIGIEIEFGKYNIKNLIDSDCIFLASIHNTYGIAEVKKIDNYEKTINNDIVKKLKKEYLKNCENML